MYGILIKASNSYSFILFEERYLSFEACQDEIRKWSHDNEPQCQYMIVTINAVTTTVNELAVGYDIDDNFKRRS